ncbi:glycosyl transferase group 1 [Chthoniobacter flavus Ellin428]|uniref:Glycosyl transferase group 1 n=1 Tax=Chthoniobacter flavus Ellin428 TaxID=497964 RepID=B4CWW8_9BACT|nr:glycosyl transferase group 1 [Chthoniobacter flavus Ellin428]TCO84942.1 glycosyltransferase involved in cell wall biosynthesis [Chthoniobacter flavus]
MSSTISSALTGGPDTSDQRSPRLLPKKLLFTISARLGGSGLDLDSFEAVKGAWQAGILGRVVAYDNRQREIPANLVRSLRWHPVRLASFLQTSHYYGAKKKYLDWVCARDVARRDFDMVHSWSGDCLRTFREAQKRGIPTVLEIPTWHRNKGKKKPALTKSERERDALPLPRRWFEQLPPTRQQILEEYDLADVILVLSDCAADTFLAAGFDKERLFSLPRGTDIERFTPGTLPPKFRAIFVGALKKRKGVDLLLETWHDLALKDAELVLVGAVHKEIEEYLARYGGPSVRVVGHVSKPEDYYRESSVHIFPSTCEGSAKVTYDAAACGLAQITTREAGDVVLDGVNGLVVPCGNKEALAEAIKKLYHNPQLLASMGKAARERIVDNFTWDHYRQRLLRAYEYALQRKRGTSQSA